MLPREACSRAGVLQDNPPVIRANGTVSPSRLLRSPAFAHLSWAASLLPIMPPVDTKRCCCCRTLLRCVLNRFCWEWALFPTLRGCSPMCVYSAEPACSQLFAVSSAGGACHLSALMKWKIVLLTGCRSKGDARWPLCFLLPSLRPAALSWARPVKGVVSGKNKWVLCVVSLMTRDASHLPRASCDLLR